jgi:hypothetical protein
VTSEGLVGAAALMDDRDGVKSSINEVLVREVAAKATENVVAKAIKHLKGLRSDLSGEDSGLGTVWLEYCAQVQGEQSYAWQHYEDLALDTVRSAVAELAAFELQAVWLDTPAGADWLDAAGSDRSAVPASADVVAKEIYDTVWQRASDWEDRRLERYKSRQEDDGDDDGDDDDDEADDDNADSDRPSSPSRAS